MKRIILTLALCYTMMWSVEAGAAVWEITYPQSSVEEDVRNEYPIALLKLALEKTGVRYELKPSIKPLYQARAVKRLEENLEINIIWTMTDNAREEHLLPIRIPIARGLIGWRFFVAPVNSDFMKAEIDSIDRLLEFEPVQGIAWADTKILQANGFNVVTSQDYNEAKQMVLTQQADFFPRSVIEVEQEILADPYTPLAYRTDIAVQYPSAMYFFVNKQNKTLARLIETGLKRAIDDGSFDTLFQEHFGEIIERLNTDELRYFKLANPLLPTLTPTSNEKLWYYPR